MPGIEPRTSGIRLEVNGEAREFVGAPETPLLWVLRGSFGLKGTKYGCGVAVYHSYGSWVAQIAEVAADGEAWRVERIVCAADCGTVVNPDAVAAQMEGATVFAATGKRLRRLPLLRRAPA